MGNFKGTSLTLVDMVSDSPTLFLDRVSAAATHEIGGKTYLYSTAADEDGLQVFAVAPDGKLTALTRFGDTAGVSLDFSLDVQAFEIAGQKFIAVSGFNDDGVTFFEASSTFPYLTYVSAVFDGQVTISNLDGADDISVFTYGNNAYVNVVGRQDHAIQYFRFDATGAIGNMGGFANSPSVPLNWPNLSLAIDIADAGWTNWESDANALLIASSNGTHGLSILGTTQALNSDRLFVETIYEDTSFRTDGRASGKLIDDILYIYQPSNRDGTIQILHYDGATVTPATKVTSSALRGMDQVRIIEHGDQTLLLAAGRNSAAVALFEIDTSPLSLERGALRPIQLLQNGVDGSLSSTGIDAIFEIDGTTFVAVTSGDTDTLSIYELGGGDDVLEGTQSDDTFTGGGGDDIIYALGGDDVIDGGADNDIIYAGSGQDTVIASTGADRSFGGSNFDRFDASDLVGGVQLDTKFDLARLADGTKQFISGFERLDGTNHDDDIRGGEANNDLRGFDGNDVLNGRGGNDSLRGHGGDDRLLGVDGNDVLFGGAGNDDLRGGRGNDTINGDDGDDFILGEGGADTLNGGRGNDTMFGGGGADVFVFDNYTLSAAEFDTIRDFANGVDKFDLSAFGFANAGAALAGASQRAWGVRWQLDADQVLSLEGAALTDLGASDLIL